MSWRYHLEEFIEPSNHLTDVYEFGVYTGQSMVDIYNVFQRKGMEIRRFFGLDSFQGLPEETAEPVAQPGWERGGFDARKHFGVDTVFQCVSRTYAFLQRQGLNCNNTRLIAGFYEDVLIEDLFEKEDMRPAAYIDIDADIYTSSYQALDFVFKYAIAQKGTLIGYDDWGGTPGWQFNLDGESRAHHEIQQKYKITFVQLAQIGNCYPHVQMIFKVL